MWTQLIVWIATSIVASILAPKPPKPQPPKPAGLGEFDLPTAEEGRPIPVVFGTVLVRSPNVVWYGDLRTVPVYA